MELRELKIIKATGTRLTAITAINKFALAASKLGYRIEIDEITARYTIDHFELIAVSLNLFDKTGELFRFRFNINYMMLNNTLEEVSNPEGIQANYNFFDSAGRLWGSYADLISFLKGEK